MKMKDFENLKGCWIDGAISRNNREIAERLSILAAYLGADSDQLAYENEDLSQDEESMWLQDVIAELDKGINEILSKQGYLAVWESGDYIIFHQSEYFESELDYLTHN